MRRFAPLHAWLCAVTAMACGHTTEALPPPLHTASQPPAPAPAPPPGPLETRAAHGSIVFHIRASPLANLAYQLDCLSKTIACTQGVFHDLWKPLWTPADDVALAVWQSVRRRYRSSLNLVDDPAPDAPRGHLNYGARLRTASLLSESIDEYVRWLEVMVLPGDEARLRATLDHFWPRFSTWWDAHGRAIVAAPLPRFAALLGDEHVANLFDRVAHFYSPELPGRTDIAFDLIARPASSGEGTHAETNDNHLVIEVGADDAVEARMPVAAHELCHFFYAARTTTATAALNTRFAASPDPLAALAAGLMNESLATLLGNVLVGRVVAPEETEQRLAEDNGLYNERNIDRTAKALVGQIDALADGTIDDDAFFTAYLHAVHVALGDSPAPSAYFREFLLGYSPAMQASAERFIHASNAGSVFSNLVTSPDAVPEVTRNPQFTVITMLSAHDLSAFDLYAKSLGPKVMQALRTEVKRGVPFVFAVPRPPHAMAFVLVADDAASMDGLADALIARQEPLVGVMR
jgi:hypothetical protein